jgi:hypothetical protein
LATLGFKGGTRSDTEWNQWVTAEKEQLALVMERHGIEWEKKGTHEEHLSVLDYKKQERAKEVTALEEQCSTLEGRRTDADAALRAAQKKLADLTADMKQVEHYAAEYNHSPDEWLPEPSCFETAKAYRKRILPLIAEVVKVIQPLYAKYLELKSTCTRLLARTKDLEARVGQLVDDVIETAKQQEQALAHQTPTKKKSRHEAR